MKKLCGIIALLATFVAALCCCIACNNQARLTTPSDIRIENDYLTWNISEGADAYLVTINGNRYITTENRYDLLNITVELTTYKMSVLAICDANSQKDSMPSKVLVYQPKPAEGLFDYTSVKVGKKKGVMIVRKDNVDDELFPEKLILPALAPDGSSVIAVGKMSNSKTKSIWIPNSVEVINVSTFANSQNLERVRLPQRLTAIGTSAFENCNKLRDVILPDTLTTLDSTAFNGCASLTEMVIPATVTKLNIATQGVFNGCESLEKIEVVQANPEKPGALFTENGCLMLGNVLLKAVGNCTIPENTETISYYAFADNKAIENLTLPNDVKTIESGAFARCSNLKSIALSEKLEILNSGFYPIFADCEKLESFTIPAKVNTIIGNLFKGCKSLTELTVAPDNTDFKAERNFILSTDGKYVFCGLLAENFPSTVKYISASAYAFSDVEQAIIPDGVKLNTRCFFSCDRLKKVALPDDINTIPDYAFKNCYNLETINIPKTLTLIAVDGFANDVKLSLTLDNVTLLPLEPLGGTTVYTSASFDTIKTYMHSGSLFANAKIGHNDNDSYVISFTYTANGENKTFEAMPFELDGQTFGVHNAAPHRNGYSFEGWATTENGSPVYKPYTVSSYNNMTNYTACLTAEELKSLADGTTLYAVWKQL